MQKNDQYLKVALNAAKKAGVIFKKNFGKPKEVEEKGGNYRNLVTATDKNIERLIKKEIHSAFPEHKILGEEFGWLASKQQNGFSWLIDPIDGTTNFIQGIPLCGISIALWDKNGPLVGVFFNPITNQLFSAARGKGAFLNGRRIHISKTAKLKQALGGVGWSKSISLGKKLFFTLLPVARKSRALGSTALQLCLVAQGAYDYYVVGDMQIWDIAAGLLIITEAGGLTTDWKGRVPGIKTANIIASNGKIHKELLNRIKNLS
jgi:myo-inositol-1(or 4)-monophosphatase